MMKKHLIFLCIACCVFVASLSGQIIANHTIVNKFDDIPQQYIDSVKKMWLVVGGESHSAGYRSGLNSLESAYPTYAVSVVESGTPEAYTTSNLRASCGTWGDLSHQTGWTYSYGEEDWFTSTTAIDRTKAGITYCTTNNITIGAIGFGWCWDPAIVDFSSYINATRSYINYCDSAGYATKVFFTTGTVDSYTGETGYNKHLGYESIRDSVNTHPTWILFDYADILCWDDDGTPNTTTWNGHVYPIITTTNLGSANIGHIGSAGVIRLAKAMWWMLARMKGWDGAATGVPFDQSDKTIPTQITLDQNYPNPFNPNTTITYQLQSVNYVILKVFDVLGKEVATLVNEVQQSGNKSVRFNAETLPSGVYFYRLQARQQTGGQAGSFTQTKKLLLLR
jgi:hypothetical protein